MQQSVTNAATPPSTAYRQLPDQGARVAQYRIYAILGKLLLALGLFLATPMTIAVIRGCGWWSAWLVLVPLGLFVALLWPGFPAFCRCPECRKRMTRSSKEGKVLRQRTFYTELKPARHYLVCHRCGLYVFLGESEA